MKSAGESRTKKRLIVLWVIVLLGLAAFLLRPIIRLIKSRPPNIILISLCSVGADHMSCYGYQRRTTPNLEELAGESIVFENAIVQWPKTMPSFAAIMTGKYGHTTGVMRITPRQRLGDEHNTLAEILRANGYDTGAFISTAALNKHTNIFQGCNTVAETWRLPYKQRFSATTTQALEWINKPRKTPFFAWVHYNSAHQPYRPVDAPADLFIGDKFYDPTKQVRTDLRQLPLNIPKAHPFAAQILRPDVGNSHPSAVLKEKPNELAYYIARYDACIFGADKLIGQLIDKVRDMGLLENAIVVVVSDHGEALGSHNYYFGHGRFAYNDCARVPLMIRPAGGTKPVRVVQPVAIFGLAPTLLEMVGVEAPRDMEARSLSAVVYGGSGGEYVFMESGYQFDYTLSVWAGNWKLIHIPNPIDRSLAKGSEYELYNLEEDPKELSNLYQSQPQIATQLKRTLKQWSDPWVKTAYSTANIAGGKIDEKTLQQLRSLGYLP